MYLIAKKYIFEDEDKEKIREVVKTIYPSINLLPKTITFEVAYWRKANAIHKWFVDNVQNGVDDCEEYFVDKKILYKLLETIEEVLENKEKAKELLPTQSGFFFGGVEYDEDYFNTLEETRNILMWILMSNWLDEVNLYYYASW